MARSLVRPLYYQKSAFVPQPDAVAADNNVVGSPAGWLRPFGKAVTVGAIFGASGLIIPPTPPVAAAVPTLPWLQPFSKAPPKTRPPLSAADLRQFAVPGPEEPRIEWLQPFRTAAEAPRRHDTQPVSGYQPAAVSNLTTTLEWMVAWRNPPRNLPQPLSGGLVYAAPPIVQVGVEWQQRNLAARARKPVHTQPVAGYQPAVAPSNLTNTLDWLQAWRGPPRQTLRLAAGSVYPWQPIVAPVAPAFNTASVTSSSVRRRSLFYQAKIFSERGPDVAVAPPPDFTTASTTSSSVRRRALFYQAKVFVARGPDVAVSPPPDFITASVTSSAVRKRTLFYQSKVYVPQQPVVVAPSPPGYVQVISAGVTRRSFTYEATPFVPPILDNTATPDKWLIRWQGPPRVTLRLAAGSVYPWQPIQPPQNTITGIAWLTPFNKPVPYPPVRHTQPFRVPQEFPYLNTIIGTGWDQPFYPVVPLHWPQKTNVTFPAYPYIQVPPPVIEPPAPGIPPKHGRGAIRTARSTTSSRWRKSRGSIRTSSSKTTPRDDP